MYTLLHKIQSKEFIFSSLDVQCAIHCTTEPPPRDSFLTGNAVFVSPGEIAILPELRECVRGKQSKQQVFSGHFSFHSKLIFVTQFSDGGVLSFFNLAGLCSSSILKNIESTLHTHEISFLQRWRD